MACAPTPGLQRHPLSRNRLARLGAVGAAEGSSVCDFAVHMGSGSGSWVLLVRESSYQGLLSVNRFAATFRRMETFTNQCQANALVQQHIGDSLFEAAMLQEVEAEALGWQPLDAPVYLHVGAADALQVVDVVGVATPDMAGHNVVWLQY